MNRASALNTLYTPTGCGAPVGNAGLQSGSGQILQQAAIYADTCGHHIYWYHPNDSSWSRIDTGGGSGSGTVTAVIISNDSVFYSTSSGNVFVFLAVTQADSTIKYITPTQLGAYRLITDTTFAHLLMTRAWGYKISDSLVATFAALYRTQTDTAYAHLLMTRLWGYKISDSLAAAFHLALVDTAAAIRGTSYGLHLQGKGQPGDTTIISAHDSIIRVAAIRDSGSFHHYINPDGSWTLYSSSTGGTDSGFAVQIAANSSGVPLAKIVSGGARFIRLDTLHTNPGALVTQQWRRALEDSLNALIGGKTDTATTDSILTQIRKKSYFYGAHQTGAVTITYVAPVGTDTAYITKAIEIINGDGTPADTTLTNDSVAVFKLNAAGANESILGPIYGKSNWTSLADFTTNGATASTSSGHIILGCSTCGTYHESLDLTGGTLLGHNRMTVYFRPNFTPTTTTYGFAAGLRSTNTVGPSDAYAVIQMVSGATAGQAMLVGGAADTQIDTSATRLTWSNGDQLAMTFERNGNSIFMTIRNLTTNSAPVPVEFSMNSQNPPTTANTGRFSLLVLGGGPYEIDSVSVSSRETVGAKLMVIGDSKSVTYYPTNFTSGWVADVATSNPDLVNLSGGSDKIEDVLKRTTEIISLKPSQILLAIGSNSIRLPEDSTVYNPAYDTLVNRLTGAGIRVIHLLPFAEAPGTGTGVDVSPLVRHILATYSLSNIIDTYHPLLGVAGAINSTDGTHPTDLGHHLIGDAILASGKITGSKTTQDFSLIQSQTAHTQNAGFRLGGNASSIYAPFTVGSEVESIPQFNLKLSKIGQIQYYSNSGTMFNLALNRAGTYGAKMNFSGSRLGFGFQTAGYGERMHMDSTGLYIGDGSGGVIASFVTGIGWINYLDFAGEQIIESSATGRSGTLPLRLDGSYIDIANAFTGSSVMIVGQGDTVKALKRVSYSGNFGSSFNDHSLPDIHWIDSVLSLMGGGSDTNSLYSSRYIIPDGTTDNSAALQTLFNLAAAKGKDIVLTPGNYVANSGLTAPTSGYLGVRWTGVGNPSINYTPKTGHLFSYSGAAFHDIRFTNITFISSKDTTSVGCDAIILQGTTTSNQIHRFSIDHCVFSGFAAAITLKGAQDGDITFNTFLAPKGHDNATTTTSPAVFVRIVVDSVGDAVKRIRIQNNIANGYSGSAAITTTKTGAPLDGFFYGACIACMIDHNSTRNFGQEHYVYQPGITFIDSGRTSISNNNIDGNIPVGSAVSGVKIHGAVGIRAEGQGLSIKDNDIYNINYGIEFIAQSAWNYSFLNSDISGNNIWMSKDTAQYISGGIIYYGYSGTPSKYPSITNNHVYIDSSTLTKTFKAYRIDNADSGQFSGNSVLATRLTKTGGGVHGIDLTNVTGMNIGTNDLASADTVIQTSSATYNSLLPSTTTVATQLTTDSSTRPANTAFVKNAIAAGGGGGGSATDGIYFPVLTDFTSAGTLVQDSAMYTRTNNTVTVDGKFAVSPLSTTVNTQVSIALPINSTVSGGHNCTGMAATQQTVNGFLTGVINGGASNTVTVTIGPTGATGAITVFYHFVYKVE